MAHRASYVIVRNGEPRIYSDRHGARSVGRDLLPGPEEAIPLIESFGADDRLYSRVWCEGGAFIDMDARTLLFFGYDLSGDVAHCLPLRRAFLLMLAERWPGWKVEWAHQGVEDFEVRLGMPPGRDYDPPRPATEREVEGARESIGMSASPSGWPYERTAADPPPCDCEDVTETLITVVGEEGGVRDVISNRRPTDLFPVGPQLLEWIAAAPPAPPTDELNVRGCFLVDLREREIETWEAEMLSDYELSRLATHWPGWRLTRQTVGLVHQWERSGRDGADVRVPESRMMELVEKKLAARETASYGTASTFAIRLTPDAARPDAAPEPRPDAAATPDPAPDLAGERPRGWLARLLGKLAG